MSEETVKLSESINSIGNENKLQDNSKVQIKQEEVIPQSSESEPIDQNQINWKKFREQREIERKQKIEAERRAAEKEAEAAALKAAMESILNKNQPQPNYFNQDQSEESEDERIEKKVQAALAKRYQQEEEIRKKREQEELPLRLNQIHKDFDKVCSEENLDYLEFHYPEVAQAYKYMPNNIEKWSSVYAAVKRFVPNTDVRKEQAKVEKNSSMPKSAATHGMASSHNGMPVPFLTEERKAANYERMRREMSRI